MQCAMCVAYLVTIKAFTIMCHQEVLSMELLLMVVIGHGLDFGKFLSYSSTHSTTGGVHAWHLTRC